MALENDIQSPLHTAKNLYLTTTGRSTGLPRRVELWFAYDDGRINLLAGSAQDDRPNHWYRNLQANPSASVEIGDVNLSVTMESVEDPETERAAIVELFLAKFGSEIVERFYTRESLLPVRLRVEQPS